MLRLGEVALRFLGQCLDQHRDPGCRLAEHDWRGLAGEHRTAHRFALDGLAVGVDHRQRAVVELAADIELRHRPLPLAQHAEQLEQEDTQLRVARLLAHLGLQSDERLLGVAGSQKFLGCGHGCQVLRISSWKLVPPPRWPVAC